MEQEFLTGKCPKCMQELRVPASLAEFSCMYCGARLTKEQLAAEPPAAQEADEDRAAYYDRAVSRLGWGIKNFGGSQKKIMRDVFFEEIETDDPVGWVRGLIKGKQVELTVDEKENGDLTVYVVCGGVSQKILMTRL